MKPHLIMPMSGAGSRFFKNGYIVPKPLIEIAGKPFFYWSTKSVEKYIDLEDITYVVLNQHIRDFKIDKEIHSYFRESKIVGVDFEEVKSGPIMTCLAGIEHITDDSPIIINDCDHLFCSSLFNDMVNDEWKSDCTVLTFESDEPQFGYIQYDEFGKVLGTVEKQVVSKSAVCGVYGFKNANMFKAAAMTYLKSADGNVNYVSDVFNVMCHESFDIKTYPVNYHVSFGTPDEYENAKSSEYFAEIEAIS